MTASITTDRLTKTYPHSSVPALDALSLTIQPGEVYGYLGANGAGKSTTIRLLMNFLQPSSGTASIMGLDSVRQSVQARRHVGYLAGDVALYTKATGQELLDYLTGLQGKTDRQYRQKLEKRFEAELDKPIQALSKGNRQKIGILQALIHQPDVLVLDEPTSGLDPLMQEAFYESIREAKAHGAAVLMSSHNLTEAQTLCDRIGIIKHGRLIREQAISGDTNLTQIVFRVVPGNSDDVAKLKSAPGLKFISQEGDAALLQPSGTLAAALTALGRFDIRSFATQQINLEDEFLEFYGDDDA